MVIFFITKIARNFLKTVSKFYRDWNTTRWLQEMFYYNILLAIVIIFLWLHETGNEAQWLFKLVGIRSAKVLTGLSLLITQTVSFKECLSVWKSLCVYIQVLHDRAKWLDSLFLSLSVCFWYHSLLLINAQIRFGLFCNVPSSVEGKLQTGFASVKMVWTVCSLLF